MLRDTENSRADELSASSRQITIRAQESAEDIHRTIRNIDVGGQFHYIDTQGREFSGPGLEKYKAEINEALQIENPEERSQKLDELKTRLSSSIQKIDKDAKDSSNDTLSLRENTENNTRAIGSRIEEIQYGLPQLHEKMGDAYYRAARQIQEIGDLNSDARNMLRRLDELPIELRLLSNAANDLGLDVSKIFEALKKGEYS
jgi:DNA repair ATPase RecN